MNRFVKVLALTAVLIGLLIAPASAKVWTEGSHKNGPVSIDSMTIAHLAEKIKPAVVNIDTEATVTFGGQTGGLPPNVPKDFRDFFERFFGRIPEHKQRRQGQGSGFIIDEEGYIITNNHVVEGAEKIVVRLLDKRQFEAKVIGADPKTDIALIKIEADDLPYVVLGDSDKLKVGEWVMAIGNPFGLGHTVTTGIVSAKGRTIGAGPYDDFIQTDASINPGNSGGPLIDFRGEVVGINTAIIARGQGIGFAVPINLVKNIVGQIVDHGRVIRAELGVVIQPVTKEIAESFGLKKAEGALIAQVRPGSAAEKAGLRQGDIILEFNGRKVGDFNDLPKLVATQPVGSKAKVKIFRDGDIKTIGVTLGEMKEREVQARAGGPDEETGQAPKLGLRVQDITPDLAESLGLKKTEGVVITGVSSDGPAAAAGLRRGDVILEVNRKAVENVKQFVKLVKKADRKKPLLLLIRRGSTSLYIPLKWGE